MESTIDATSWIRRLRPCRESTRTLVFFPHAGGSASYYHPLAARVSASADVVAVQYPGRQDRLGEPPLRSIGEIADRTAEALLALTHNELAFFGHSMGTAVAFEVARRLRDRARGPSILFVSGARAPSLARAERVHLLDDQGMVAELREHGGTDPVVLNDPELLEMLLPAVRGDYTAIERYRCAPEAVIDSPVVALTGSEDAEATVEDVAPWRRHTSSAFELHVFTGGHFYLQDCQEAVAELVTAKLAELSASGIGH